MLEAVELVLVVGQLLDGDLVRDLRGDDLGLVAADLDLRLRALLAFPVGALVEIAGHLGASLPLSSTSRAPCRRRTRAGRRADVAAAVVPVVAGVPPKPATPNAKFGNDERPPASM